MTQFLTRMGTGEAANWARPALARLMANLPHEHTRNWGTLREAFLTNFGDPIKKERAIRDIVKLTQTGSAQHYTTQFRMLAEELEWGEQALIDRYKQGLKPAVQRELLRSSISMNTDFLTLEGWITLAIKTDDILYAANGLGNTTNTTTTNPFKRTEQGKAANTNTGSQREYILVPQEVIEKRKTENRCIKCGGTGHRISTCKSTSWKNDPTKIQGKTGTIEEVVEEPKN